MNLQKYTIEELFEMATPYLEKLDAIWCTTDGQFFYDHACQYAKEHASSNKGISALRLTKDQYLQYKNKGDSPEKNKKTENIEYVEKNKPGRKKSTR